jgi:hypothetical protein
MDNCKSEHKIDEKNERQLTPAKPQRLFGASHLARAAA